MIFTAMEVNNVFQYNVDSFEFLWCWLQLFINCDALKEPSAECTSASRVHQTNFPGQERAARIHTGPSQNQQEPKESPEVTTGQIRDSKCPRLV